MAVEAVRACLRELRIAPYREARRAVHRSCGASGVGGDSRLKGSSRSSKSGCSGSGELRYLQLTAVGTQPGNPAAQDDPLASVQARCLTCFTSLRILAWKRRILAMADEIYFEGGLCADCGSASELHIRTVDCG